MTKKRVFSGIQPTGDIHIGNYMGALRNWVAMQEEYDAIYCVVDLHALTLPQDPAELSAARLRTAKILLASGIDPQRSMLYYQSQVPQHAELSWIIGTFASMGHLGRMTQYKEKGDKGAQNLGLFAYPVLMAADILLHKVHVVPVGDDQTQHLEFTRGLVARFNARFGDHFPLPEQVTPGVGARVMSLKDPTTKMSKSDPDVKSRILVIDEPDVIRKKVRSAVTDSGGGISYNVENKAGVSNLLDIMGVFTGRSIDDLVAQYADMQYGTFKDAVADAVIEGLSELRQTYKALNDREVERLMTMGALDARTRAEHTMAEIRKAVGLNA
jgi:tryptophanyl-tRNA synthetase